MEGARGRTEKKARCDRTFVSRAWNGRLEPIWDRLRKSLPNVNGKQWLPSQRGDMGRRCREPVWELPLFPFHL